jgi:hypothetical protein
MSWPTGPYNLHAVDPYREQNISAIFHTVLVPSHLPHTALPSRLLLKIRI